MTARANDRIVTLDVIRGVAVMGIFSVNVVAFAMIEAAYFNPPVYGFDGLADRIMWFANFVLVDGKMRSLFSMLFGASLLLVAERADRSGQSAASVHYRRMAVLLLFGLAHFYFVWFGDILTTYAIVGMLAFAFWRAPAANLALLALITYVAAFVISVGEATGFAAHVASAQASGDPSAIGYYGPTAQAIQNDLTVHSSYGAFVADTTGRRLWNPVDIVETLFPETLALMLLGMAGYRSGFLTGAWSMRTYKRIAAIGLTLGIIAGMGLAAWVWIGGFRLPWTVTALETWSMPLHPLMALSYAALIVWLASNRGRVAMRFAAVGRAAFTNYLGTSLVAAAIFNGWGLGLYGQLSRAEAWLLVPIFWAAMLAWSKPWLDRFSYGPFEWLWRSLSRGRPQPMRKPALAV
ncbi:DUF418 domain-containing protein [Sphingomonas sinipercae]|uniref:DUF418 domain-containing protein n=1 Tax=Sphingomonas sinipercae TaxID=2714944 RepID=A0A6G7ZQB1_9SPHN|nr:DUF418 domain-containing protein [Sphingomonas sinipercae]QIL03090.1 DUF418 domain-containing protein [Sphingomonas sinipercae]